MAAFLAAAKAMKASAQGASGDSSSIQ